MKNTLLDWLRTASDVVQAALLTWLLFMAVQAVAMQFILRGV